MTRGEGMGNAAEDKLQAPVKLSARQQEELKAFILMARRYTVPLIEEDDSTAAILGTATLFSANSRHYLITAAHVIEELVAAGQTDRIGIPLGLEKASVCNLGNHYIAYNSNTDVFDIAIIRLDEPKMVAAVSRNWDFLSPKNVAGIDRDMRKCFVAGYPRSESRTAADWQMSSKFISFPTTFLHETPTEAEGVRVGLDVFLVHEERGTALDGSLVDLPALQGVSGASVWAVLPDREAGVWSPESSVRVVAVEVACRSGSYIRAKGWALVAKLFEALDPQAAEEITRALDM